MKGSQKTFPGLASAAPRQLPVLLLGEVIRGIDGAGERGSEIMETWQGTRPSDDPKPAICNHELAL
jgi:hypothetical protein